MMRLDDTQLINRILEGDIRCYSVLVDRHKDLAFTIAYRLLNSREDAEEVVQDGFVKAYQNLKGFRRDSKFSTWLFRIVYNTAVSKRRTKKNVFRSIEESGIKENTERFDSEDEINTERGLILERAIQHLHEEERVLLTLFYIRESSVEEIHDITGLTKTNIKVKLYRARKKLQELVGVMNEKIYI